MELIEKLTRRIAVHQEYLRRYAKLKTIKTTPEADEGLQAQIEVRQEAIDTLRGLTARLSPGWITEEYALREIKTSSEQFAGEAARMQDMEREAQDPTIKRYFKVRYAHCRIEHESLLDIYNEYIRLYVRPADDER